ncbi:hypothetical protein [Kineococcus sp. G2]|uniref:hypothetical protein n=1 Tax=Kineococcus sp. G2 TaxID=3127484 RepID=UPI00301BA666
MPASSLIFLTIVVLWAAYLVPAAIRRRRHAGEARVGDRDSEALRVVVRQGSAPAERPGALAVSSSRPVLAGPVPHPQLTAPVAPAPAPAPAPAAAPRVLVQQSRASRVVRRRRRLLGAVLGAAVVTWALVLASVAPAWAALLPTAALALVVVALRRHAAAAPAPVLVPTAVVPAPAAPAEDAGRAGGTVLDELTAQLERELAEELAAARTAADGAVPAPRPRPEAPAAAADGAGWEPAEVPLPTYLLKPRARLVRPARAGAPVAGPVEVDVQVTPAPSVRGRRVIDVREPSRVVNG